MIAKLTGTVDATGRDTAVIDVNGVGYLIFASRRTLDRLGATGQPATVLVETHVREDHIHLYGFADAAERDWFRRLTGVQGVGGRVALSILGVIEPDGLTMAILAQDKAPLVRAEGVGPKLAGRILSELKHGLPDTALSLPASAPAQAADTVRTASNEAVSALVNLGFDRSLAFGAVTRAGEKLGAEAPVESLIPEALRELSP